ncbi:HlyD family efflux transporter periplasmic adaptor subunit [Alcaligenes faecalis]|uniref:efflux RND transporter periplasmic adaptor subunit n=1 Tax=Alcaligenes faecalis TaxID=511 RepID=UPI001293E294|nr:HlyD family efflux transporter periplasmic adaptor subunit [Alcaligenes faecalis]MBX6963166.1 HlyD family efflux transporter periplasmic adaptor subunit [Providencia rettgeri]MBX7029816.1 HlyD family efflux transporter periplasmic adaptor subunit [Alcaligenes faecalis]QFY78688.1 HlyD family efflux transporter periplasmic adaptor subunit [Alcaligenes faecalis]
MTKRMHPKPERRHSKIYLALLIVLLLIGGTWLGLRTQPAPPPLSSGTWLLIQPQTLENTLGLVGTIEPVQQATLAAPFNGLIREVLAQEGQNVAAGQTLLRLDPGQIEIQLRQAQSELLKAQRELEQLQNWDSSPDVARSKRALHAAQSSLANVQANLRDTRALFERGIVARMEVDTLTQQLQTQEQSLISAKEELRLIQARGQGEDRKIAEMSLSNAQARYQDLLRQVEQQDLKAPFAGFVIPAKSADGSKPLSLQTGLQISQGTPVLTVVGLEQIQVLTQVSEMDVQQLQIGMPVRITGDGFPGQTLQGQIASIAIQSNTTGGRGVSYDVRVAVDTPLSELKDKLRLGMSTRLTVTLWRMKDGLVIPSEALNTETDGTRSVRWRADASSPAEQIKVIPGKATLGGIQVRGLKPGEVYLPG